MKLLSNAQPNLFERKVNVELSLAEIIIIRQVFAKQSLPQVQQLLTSVNFPKLAKSITGDCGPFDTAYNIYKGADEIMLKFGVKDE